MREGVSLPAKEINMHTLLETVNYVIAQTGAAPVDSLVDPLPDVASAQLRIQEALVRTQVRGWWFNTNFDVVIEKDGNNKYPIPADTIKILRASPFYLIDRGSFAYDPYSQTDTFPEGPANICVDLVYLVPYEQCPYSVQEVVRYAAARDHILLELEDVRKADTLQQDLTNAVVEMRKDDLEIKRRNMAYSPKFIRTRGRVRPYRWGGRTVNPSFPGGGR